jgi:hypothetical protein
VRTRITHVRLTTALIYDPNPDDDSVADSRAFAARSWTCDVRYPTCKVRKKTAKKTTGGPKPDPSGTPPTATPPDGGTTRPPTAQFGEGGGT